MIWMAKKLTASTWPQPDFMPAAQRPGVLVWVWLLLVCCAVLALGLRWQDLQAQRAVLSEQAGLLSRLSNADQGKASKTAPANEAELQRRAWALAAQLSAQDSAQAGGSWASRWLDVERALPPGLQLQALEMEGASLRLEGLAPQAELVMQLVDRLSMQAAQQGTGAGAASEVVLTRLQRPEGSAEGAQSADANALRFEVVRRRATGQRS